MRMRIIIYTSAALLIACIAYVTQIWLERRSVEPVYVRASQWRTDMDKRSIPAEELMSGGPGKDGIPSINDPKLVSIAQANTWIDGAEPLISLRIEGQSRAYPLQILTWHEIVNDQIGEMPVSVTYCPLCNSGIVFDRRVNNRALSFGVSGMLRRSDMIMYDHQTESWWQQFTGEALVGELTGTRLKMIPSQILSYDQFKAIDPNGLVLSRDTGLQRNYGSNPYVGYDDPNQIPSRYRGPTDARLRPMARVIGVREGKHAVAYAHAITATAMVVHDQLGTTPIAVFHLPGAVSALDQPLIANSRHVGSTGVFDRRLGNHVLTFRKRGDVVLDHQSQSTWDITGRAIDGPLKGKRLKAVECVDTFAFAWLAFHPDSEIFTRE